MAFRRERKWSTVVRAIHIRMAYIKLRMGYSKPCVCDVAALRIDTEIGN